MRRSPAHLRLIEPRTIWQPSTAPDGPTDEWAARKLAEHAHTASAPGVDCATCGFPWWPERGS